MHRAALHLIPALGRARILEAWAGLRPGTRDNLPILGPMPTPGYFVATGHFRDGLLLTPATAHVMAQVATGAKPEYEISPFSPLRPHVSCPRARKSLPTASPSSPTRP